MPMPASVVQPRETPPSPFDDRRRRRRRRRVPSAGERLAGGVLLAILFVIAVAVYRAGGRPSPDLLAPDPSLFARPPEAARGGSEPLRHAVASTASGLTDAAWHVEADATAFEPDRLHEKIDGRAELYLRAGVRHLVAVTVASGDRFIDALVYDMGRPDAADQRLADERPPGARSTGIGRDGYAAAGSYFFATACFYAQIVASDDSAATARGAELLARRLAPALENTSCR